MRFLQPCVLFAVAVIAGAVLSEAATNTGHAQPLQDVTFQGNIDVVSLPQSNFEGGGTISLTFTSDMAAIRRTSVEGFTVGSPPSLVRKRNVPAGTAMDPGRHAPQCLDHQWPIDV